MAVHRTVGATHLLYALSVSTMLVYWWWEAETLFPVCSPLQHSFAPFVPPATAVVAMGIPICKKSRLTAAHTHPSASEPTERRPTQFGVHWFDLCKLAWLPVITSLYCCLSTIVPDALPTHAREYRWHKRLFSRVCGGSREMRRPNIFCENVVSRWES